MIEGMRRRGKEKRDGSIGQRAGRMCEYPSDVCSQRWPHSRRLAPHGRRTESGKHGRESISHKIPTSRHHPFGYLCRFLLHRVYASSFSCFRLYIYTLSRKVYSFWGIERGFGGGKNGQSRSLIEREIGKSRTAREKENRLVKIGRYLALFSLRRTFFFFFFFKENANSFLSFVGSKARRKVIVTY